jgi:hypothetical protein
MNWWGLAAAVLSGTALAAVLGKLLDLWLLEPMRARSEQRRWLRETRLEAFSRLSEEVLSFGLKNATFDDIWKFRTISARAELLVDDAKLLGDIRGFISDLYEMNAHGLTRMKAAPGSNDLELVLPDGSRHAVPDDFALTLSDGTTLTKADIANTTYFISLEKRADDLVARLGASVRAT